jgi:hypothetical protein
MELTAFGAIMKFAMDREEEITALVKTMQSAEGSPSFEELGDRIAADAAKSTKLLERTRREHVNELVLEPVTGLDGSNYDLKERASGQLARLEAGKYLLGMLEAIIAFYGDAAARITNPEARRTFDRIAKAKVRLKASIEEYLSSLT